MLRRAESKYPTTIVPLKQAQVTLDPTLGHSELLSRGMHAIAAVCNRPFRHFAGKVPFVRRQAGSTFN